VKQVEHIVGGASYQLGVEGFHKAVAAVAAQEHLWVAAGTAHCSFESTRHGATGERLLKGLRDDEDAGAGHTAMI
jgi:hypothetical protein